MGRSVIRRPKRGGQRQGPSVQMPLYGVFRLILNLDKLLDVLLHPSIVG